MPHSSIKYFGIIILLVLSGGAFMFFNKAKEAPIVPTQETPVVEQVRKIIGSSVAGRVIERYSYGSGPTKIILVGGIHGGYEWNTVLLAYEAIDYFESHPESIPKNITVEIIPVANPDGLYKVTGKEGRFVAGDASSNTTILASGRFNQNDVDLNRNFDCKWQPKSTWRSKEVSAGASAFSEPEAKALRNFLLKENPAVVVFWHSQSNGVYASQCEQGILPETLAVMNVYAEASNYPAVKTFDAYATTGAADDWLASIGIPAVTVELTTHETVERERNLAGVRALIEHFDQKTQGL